MAHSIFINYRRNDSSAEAKLIHKAMEDAFGIDTAFLDVDDIHSGEKWMQALDKAGKNAKVTLVLIGDKWLEKVGDEKPRLFNRGDWVREEIEEAINRNMTIVPVLIKGVTALTDKKSLPPSLQSLGENNFKTLRHESWDVDVKKLIEDIAPFTGIQPDENYMNPDAAKLRNDAAKLKKNKILVTTALVIITLIAAILGFDKCKQKSSTTEIVNPPAPVVENCQSFNPSYKFKALIFPSNVSHEEQININKEIDKIIRQKCSASFSPEVKYANEKLKDISSSQIKDIANECGADLAIWSINASNGSREIDYIFTDDSITVFSLNNKLESIESKSSINSLSQSIDKSLDKVTCILIAFKANQQKDYSTVISTLESCRGVTAENKTAGDLLTDAYYKEGMIDSAIAVLDRMENSVQKIDKKEVILKKAVLASKSNNPGKAIGEYTKVIENKEDKPSKEEAKVIFTKRGEQYEKSGDLIKAKNDYRVGKANANHLQVTNEIRQIQNSVTVKPITAITVPTNFTTLVNNALQVNNLKLANALIEEANKKGINSDTLKAYKAEIQYIQQPKMEAVIMNVDPKLLQINQRLNAKVEIQKVEMQSWALKNKNGK